jgi:hypothetical protein
VGEDVPVGALGSMGAFGSRIDWQSPPVDITMIVELPFWLMVDDCTLQVPYDGASYRLALRDRYIQWHAGPVLESRSSLVWQGPEDEAPALTDEVRERLETEGGAVRLCRSTVRISGRAHADVFAALKVDAAAPLRRADEARIYLATLCEAHVPVLNELIQRYRLATYDYFPYAVAPWDVPVWSVEAPGGIAPVTLLKYASWDRKPVIHDQDKTGDPRAPTTSFRFTDGSSLRTTDTARATPGEFDLLDARSLMERGDYTGAVRRSVTAVEAVLEHALRAQLGRTLPAPEVERRLTASQNDYPGRYRQWKKLSGVHVSTAVESAFNATRSTRHDIVHRSRRLTHADRGLAQMSVDNSRWLFNLVEEAPDRAHLRERPHSLQAVGRASLAPRFGAMAGPAGIRVVQPAL